MTVTGETGGIGSKAIRTEDPVTEGKTLGTTKLSEEFQLKPDETQVTEEESKGL